jgi:hypothetical protein
MSYTEEVEATAEDYFGIFVLPVYIRESTFKKYSKMSSEKLCDDLILN